MAAQRETESKELVWLSVAGPGVSVAGPGMSVVWMGLVAAQRETEGKELVAKLHQERMDSTFQRDMLHYLIQDKVDIDIDDSLITHREGSFSRLSLV